MKHLTQVAFAAALGGLSFATQAQTQSSPQADDASVATLPIVTVRASADASAQGLSPEHVGKQVARGGRAAILGTKDNLDTPFSITAYTNQLIQDRQAKGVGDVLQNDASVRFNGALRDGGTAVKDESSKLGLAPVGVDWQDNKPRQTRTSISLGNAVTAIPKLPDNDANFAQPSWSYSNEKDVFGTFRAALP